MDIPLPAGVIINITGLKLWTHTSFGGPNNTAIGLMPILQHVDATQIMVSFHAPGDTIVCNGTTYNPQPSGAGGVLVHDIAISGMGAAATNTDIGVLLNAGSSAGLNIVGGGQIFGGPAVMGTGTSTFLQNMGQPGAQLEGCKTYNSGALPVSGFTLGGGFCGAVMNLSLDGGADNTYASDAQAFASGAAAGPCYPNCAAYIAEDSGGYDNDIFVQVSGVGVQYLQNAIKSANVRVDRTSREAIRIGNGHGIGGVTLSKVVIDTVCQDSALQPNYSAGLPTACYAIYNVNAALVEDATVSNSAGILGPSYVQCSVYDQGSGSAGASNSYAFIGGQGNVNSTNPNNRVFCGAFDNSAVSGRVYFPTMAPLVATTVNPDVNGVNNIALNGQTVTTITGGVGSQTLWVYGPGTLQQGSGPNNSSNANNILNLTGQNVTLASGQVVEYMQIRNLAQNVWRMVAGPPNQTPTHVNYAGNPTPSNPSLLDSYSTIQARAVPAFNLTGGTGAIQLFGPTAPSGQACFVQEALFPDNSHVVSAQSCTAVDISALTSGEIWVVPQPQATMNLWLVSNSEPNGIATGKYPAAASGPSGAFWNYTVVGAGGDGTTPVVPGDNDTGEFWAPFGVLLSTGTQPTCSAEYHNLLWTVQNATTGDTFEQCQQISGGSYAWVSFPQVTTTGATVVNYSGGVAVTRTPGTNVTSVTCTSSICTTARGNLSIVGGTATTGTIATIGFNDSPTSSLTCQVNQEGGTSWYGIGHTISGSTLTVTAANSVSGATFMVSWQCSE